MISRSSDIRAALRARRRQRGFIINPFLGASGDPYFANVVMLLHLDETTPVDYSMAARTMFRTGTTRSSTQSKAGGFSYSFDGSGDYVSTGNSADLNFGTGDFTAEMWIFMTAADFGLLYETGNNPFTGAASLAIAFDATRVILAGQANAAGVVLTGLTTLSLNAWHHVAVQRSGTTWSLYVDGVRDVTATSAVNLTGSGETTMGGTARSNADSVTGFIDEVRVTKWVARYSGTSFTPPGSPFPNS